mmetsp:Transcript_115482/g.204012  ORF Transcript_115482/g.204012 Transcript_115482/m.204012 type:complete len:123 (+) Transcript_115482:757-1125(+)
MVVVVVVGTVVDIIVVVVSVVVLATGVLVVSVVVRVSVVVVASFVGITTIVVVLFVALPPLLPPSWAMVTAFSRLQHIQPAIPHAPGVSAVDPSLYKYSNPFSKVLPLSHRSWSEHVLHDVG